MKHPDTFRHPRALAGASADTPLCVALSGGADSVALLLMLAGDPLLSAVHVHHGIRGEEADRDADFCRRLCERLCVPLTVLHIDAPKLAKERGVSLETAARDGRYAAITAHMKQQGIPLLATAHHANDQLETMLQHLLRGSGLLGLCGIPACRALEDGYFVTRPLLLIAKETLLAYLEAAGQDFVTDSTNQEGCCTRNRLRLEVTPILEQLYPGSAATAARCADTLREDELYLTELADTFLKNESNEPSCAALAALPRPVFQRVMRSLLPLSPERTHIDALASFCQKATPHSTLSVPGGTMTVESGRLCLLSEPVESISYDIPLHEGENPLPSGGAVLLYYGAHTPPVLSDCRYAVQIPLCAEHIKGTLRARTMHPGDKLRAGGMTRTVRRLCGSGISAATRARMPLLADDNGVAAVPFGKNHNVRDDLYHGDSRDLTVYLHFD